jgi:chitinase
VRFLSGILLLACCAAAGAATSAPRDAIIAYVFTRGAVLQPGSVDAKSLTRVNYAFALIQNSKMVEGTPNDAQNLAALTALREKDRSLQVLVSVGGWLGSGGFSDASLTAESRRVFVQSAVAFVERYQLDGLDVDWEYPGMIGAGNTFRPEDKQNFTLLMKELRAALDKSGKRAGRRMYLSLAAGASTEFLEHTEMREVQKYVDDVNLMSYDYYEPGSYPTTGHHAPLFTNPADPKKISADESVKEFEAAGVPAKKLALGMPFYGHVWGSVPDKDHGLYQPGKPVPNAFAPFSIIESTMLNNGYTRYWDSAASVPYLFNAATGTFVSYEDEQSAAAKCRYVLSHRLAGVMFWSLEGDSNGKLLNSINQTLHAAAR